MTMPPHAPDGDVELNPLTRSLLMGVVNATVDSFSDAGRYPDYDSRVALIDSLIADGADVIDIGGQSAITGVPETEADDEIAAVKPLVAYVAANHPSVTISVDTYKPAVVRAVLDAGATIINDVSGLLYPEVASYVAEADAHLVVTHNLSKPKQRLTEAALYSDLITEVVDYLADKIRIAVELGIRRERLILDPGPDFSKTPHQTATILAGIDALSHFGLPVLMAVSRKDFIGAVLSRRPDERLAGTLGVMAVLEQRGHFIYRVHDVRACRDFLTMADVMHGRIVVPEDLDLDPSLRRVPPAAGPAASA
jgi:dihydropteroate synthase